MNDREPLFARIRAAVAHREAHPGRHPEPPLDASYEAFAAALGRAGGRSHGPVGSGELGAAVSAQAEQWAAGQRIVTEPSVVELLGAGRFEVAVDGAVPGSFSDVAVAIAVGWLGVAENGAVAILGRDAPHRSLLFLAERLILLLNATRVVADLHSGFRALPDAALRSHHLTWIAGPSKTADIEQTLVKGAHGPRELAVFGYFEGGAG